LITHPDYLLLGENMKLYEEFLIFLKSFTGLWNVLSRDLAEFCLVKSI